MLLLIEAYLNWLKDPKRQMALRKKIADRWISTQYKEFKQEFATDVKCCRRHCRVTGKHTSMVSLTSFVLIEAAPGILQENNWMLR